MRVRNIVNALLGITLANAKLIMLIRHGEKISDDYTDLSPQGQARAECLTETFGINGIYTSPQKIYAQRPTEQRQSTRPRDTVIPLSKSLGLEVDLSFTSGKFQDLAQYIYSSPEEVILVSWGNDRIPRIAEELGIVDVPEWKGKVFDDVWVITDGKTPYLKSNVGANANPTSTYPGTMGLNMYVHKENVEQCMNQRLNGGVSNANGQLSSDTTIVNGNATLDDSQKLQNSSSAMAKFSTVTLVTILSTLLYFLY